MNAYEETVAKLQQLPESLIQEVRDFVNFLLVKAQEDNWRLGQQSLQVQETAESDFSDYLPRLEEYENLLAEGKVQW
jgi:Protein of unknown function (DUF2281)